MKLKYLIFVLALTLGSIGSYSQGLDMITREQAREAIDFMCRQSANADITQKLEERTGITGVRNINTIIDDHTLEMKYIIPEYNLGNSPAEQAFSLLCLAGGAAQLSPYQIDMMTGLFEKGGFNLRIVNTDGASHTCTVNITPTQLNKLWKGDLVGGGVNRDLALQGIVKAFADTSNYGASLPGITGSKTAIDGRWVNLEIEMADMSPFNSISPETMKYILLNEFASTPVVSKLAGALLPNSDFMGLDGIKVIYRDSTSKMDVYLTWAELMNNI